MEKLTKCYLDVAKLCEIDGLVHAYFFDTEHRLIACNQLQSDFIRESLGVTEIIGCHIRDVFGPKHVQAADLVCQENMDVIESRSPKQFYNIWVVNGLYKLDVLTVKMPFYDAAGELLGVFGISQYVNKFSAPNAVKLGLTKRETECLMLFLNGESVKQVASKLNVSVRTVETHLDHMKIKLNCSSKSELIMKVLQSDVVEGIAIEPAAVSRPLTLTKNIAHSLVKKVKE